MNFKSLDNLREEDLTPDLRLLLGASDMDTVRKLLFHLQSTELYIPKIASLPNFAARCVRERDGSKSINELASEIGVSRRFLEKIAIEERRKHSTIHNRQSPINKRKTSVDG